MESSRSICDAIRVEDRKESGKDEKKEKKNRVRVCNAATAEEEEENWSDFEYKDEEEEVDYGSDCSAGKNGHLEVERTACMAVKGVGYTKRSQSESEGKSEAKAKD